MEFKKRNVLIFVISGKAGTGKDAVANLLKDHYKNSIILSYAFYLKHYAKKILGWDGNPHTKPREFLQNLGCELIKENISDSMLVDRMIEDILVYSYFYDVIIIDDARFPNEIDTIRNKFDNVYVIHMKGNKNILTDKQRKHISETSLDSYNNYDFEIENDYNMEDLTKTLEGIVNSI